MDLQIVFDELTKLVLDIVRFIPRLINGLLILLVGYLVAALARWLVRFILSRIGFDDLMEQRGIADAMRGIGIKTPLSRIAAQTIFVLLLLSFSITATRLIGLEAVAIVLEQLLTYLPNVVAALIVFLVGGIVARFAGDLVTTIAAGGDLSYAGRLGRLVQYLIGMFVVVLALGTLGIETAVLITALTIMIAAFGLALGLALGLGARNVVYQILTGYYTRQRFSVGQQITLDEVQGEVSSVGGVNTVVTTADGALIIPNSVLFESVVQTPQRPASETPPDQADQPS